MHCVPTKREFPDSCFNIYTAWASALLILGYKAMRRPHKRDER